MPKSETWNLLKVLGRDFTATFNGAQLLPLPNDARQQLINDSILIQQEEEPVSIPCPVTKCPDWMPDCCLQLHDHDSGVLLGLCNYYGACELNPVLVKYYDFSFANFSRNIREINNLREEPFEICRGLYFSGCLQVKRDNIALILTAPGFPLDGDLSSSRRQLQQVEHLCYLDLGIKDRHRALRDTPYLYASLQEVSDYLTLDINKLRTLLEAKKRDLRTSSFPTKESLYPYFAEVNGQTSHLDQAGYEELLSRKDEFDFLVDGIEGVAYSRNHPGECQKISDNEIYMLAEFIFTKKFLSPGAILDEQSEEASVRMFERIRQKVCPKTGRNQFQGFRMRRDPHYSKRKLFKFQPEEISYCIIIPSPDSP